MSEVDGGGIGPLQRAQEARMKAQQSQETRQTARQSSSKASFAEEASESFNPYAADKEIQFKSMRERRNEATKPQVTREQILEAQEEAWEVASEKERQNWELGSKTLRNLRGSLLAKGANAEEILAEVLAAFDDPALADEALEYLYDTTYGKTKEQVAAARDQLQDRYGEETVKAGRNMGPESREYSQTGIGNPKSLRSLYRDVIGTPRSGNKLFQELSGKFGFDKLKQVVEFLLRALGADLRSKGSSIPRGELVRLVTETRVLQSILGVFAFFLEREQLIRRLFEQNDIPFKEELEFEDLAQSFIDLVEERYPTSMKIYQMGMDLGINTDTLAQIIIFTQCRDAIRGVAPRIYRSLQHRFDLLTALLDTLEELEDKLEEEEEEE